MCWGAEGLRSSRAVDKGLYSVRALTLVSDWLKELVQGCARCRWSFLWHHIDIALFMPHQQSYSRPNSRPLTYSIVVRRLRQDPVVPRALPGHRRHGRGERRGGMASMVRFGGSFIPVP